MQYYKRIYISVDRKISKDKSEMRVILNSEGNEFCKVICSFFYLTQEVFMSWLLWLRKALEFIYSGGMLSVQPVGACKTGVLIFCCL